MKVKELIQKLLMLEPEMEVYVPSNATMEKYNIAYSVKQLELTVTTCAEEDLEDAEDGGFKYIEAVVIDEQ